MVSAGFTHGPERRLKCRGGPLDGLRLAVLSGATEVAVPLPVAAPGVRAVAALYRVERRRRGRGAAFAVLAYVRNLAPSEASA